MTKLTPEQLAEFREVNKRLLPPLGGAQLQAVVGAFLAHIEALESQLADEQSSLAFYVEKYEHNVKMLQGVLNSYTLEEAKAVAKQALGEGVA